MLALLLILVIKGFVLRLQALVGAKSYKRKPEIQGFTPTDRWIAVCLFSMRAEKHSPQ
jgi:hypothetical protein